MHTMYEVNTYSHCESGYKYFSTIAYSSLLQEVAIIQHTKSLLLTIAYRLMPKLSALKCLLLVISSDFGQK